MYVFVRLSKISSPYYRGHTILYTKKPTDSTKPQDISGTSTCKNHTKDCCVEHNAEAEYFAGAVCKQIKPVYHRLQGLPLREDTPRYHQTSDEYGDVSYPGHTDDGKFRVFESIQDLGPMFIWVVLLVESLLPTLVLS